MKLELLQNLDELGADFFTDALQLGELSVIAEEVRDDGGPLYPFMDPEVILEVYENTKPFQDAFMGMTLDVSDELRNVVHDGFSEGKIPTTNQLINKMDTSVNALKNRLDVISRTEAQRFINTGRELEYNRLEEERQEIFLYRWAVRHDFRTSDICEEIERRVPAEGLTMEELKSVVYQVQAEMMGTKWIPSWVPHPNCRSRILKTTSR